MNKTSILTTAMLLMGITQMDAQLIKGRCQGFMPEDSTVLLLSRVDVNGKGQEVQRLHVAADGTFVWNGDMTGRQPDVNLFIARERFGIHLTPGKTATALFTRDAEGKTHLTPGGAAKEISRAFNALSTAYYGLNYYSIDSTLQKPYALCHTMLDKNHAEVTRLIKGLKDKELRSRYARRSADDYEELKLSLIKDSCRKSGTPLLDSPDFQALLKGNDINGDKAIRTGLSFAYVNAHVAPRPVLKGDMLPFCREMMRQCDRLATNPKLRTIIAKEVGYEYFEIGGNNGDYHSFYRELCQWAGPDSVLYAPYKAIMASWDQTKVGAKAYDIILNAPDGQTVHLRDITKGKFTYIDIWATWCGPCKKQIPYLEQVVKRQKDNKMLQVIGLSIDENLNAWKKMIGEKKWPWAQYNIHGAAVDQLFKEYAITTIPRFIMIDPDGNLFKADAPQPSDPQMEQIIIEQTK